MYYNALTGQWQTAESSIIPADLPQTSEEVRRVIGIKRNMPTAWQELAALRASKPSPRKGVKS